MTATETLTTVLCYECGSVAGVFKENERHARLCDTCSRVNPDPDYEEEDYDDELYSCYRCGSESVEVIQELERSWATVPGTSYNLLLRNRHAAEEETSVRIVCAGCGIDAGDFDVDISD